MTDMKSLGTMMRTTTCWVKIMRETLGLNLLMAFQPGMLLKDPPSMKSITLPMVEYMERIMWVIRGMRSHWGRLTGGLMATLRSTGARISGALSGGGATAAGATSIILMAISITITKKAHLIIRA